MIAHNHGAPFLCETFDLHPPNGFKFSLRRLAIFLNGSLSVLALRRTAKVVRFRALAIVSVLLALKTSSRSSLSRSGVQGRRGVPAQLLHTTGARQLTSERQDMVPSKLKMLLTCQWQMSEAEERRRLFEDETGRNFGQHAGETSLSFESFAERR